MFLLPYRNKNKREPTCWWLTISLLPISRSNSIFILSLEVAGDATAAACILSQNWRLKVSYMRDRNSASAHSQEISSFLLEKLVRARWDWARWWWRWWWWNVCNNKAEESEPSKRSGAKRIKQELLLLLRLLRTLMLRLASEHATCCSCSWAPMWLARSLKSNEMETSHGWSPLHQASCLPPPGKQQQRQQLQSYQAYFSTWISVEAPRRGNNGKAWQSEITTCCK